VSWEGKFCALLLSVNSIRMSFRAAEAPTLDLQKIQQTLKESLTAERMLVFLNLLYQTIGIIKTLEDSVKVFNVKHGD
jgi:hypothetical protein